MKISVASGDGIGPEIMTSVLEIFEKAQVPLQYERVDIGKAVALAGDKSGISESARESVEATGVLFKGPCETPIGRGYKSVNVTARKMWGTFANKRIARTLPGVPTPLGQRRMELTMVRENIEDTYGGIEHMQTHDVAQCRRLISRPGCEQVHRYTFEMAARKEARRVTCAHKANIMKLTDGLFLKTFYEVAQDYPELVADDVLVDALAMRLVLDPADFDVIVIPNLQGDILSDLAAGLVGGLAYAPSANVGDGVCIFESVHGTAPDIAGKGLANPTALLLSGTMMLRHVGLSEHANVIEKALEQALHRMYQRPDPGEPLPPFSTESFTDHVTRGLEELEPVAGSSTPPKRATRRLEPKMRETQRPQKTELNGVDIFLESAEPPRIVAETLMPLATEPLELKMISNRGTQVWPSGSAFTDCVNHYRVRFESEHPVTQAQLIEVLQAVTAHYPLCGSEWLRTIDGEIGYSLAQGQR